MTVGGWPSWHPEGDLYLSIFISAVICHRYHKYISLIEYTTKKIFSRGFVILSFKDWSSSMILFTIYSFTHFFVSVRLSVWLFVYLTVFLLFTFYSTASLQCTVCSCLSSQLFLWAILSLNLYWQVSLYVCHKRLYIMSTDRPRKV